MVFRIFSTWMLLCIVGSAVFYGHWIWQSDERFLLVIALGFFMVVFGSLAAGLYLWLIGCGVYHFVTGQMIPRPHKGEY